MLQISSWPSVILHLDGDAFFASVLQATNPRLKGLPIVVGQERGIATAVSYEAKRMGVKRGMRCFEIKKQFPRCQILDSDYETYSLFSQKMFAIMRETLLAVEEYSVDEGFADLKGLQRPLNKNYQEIGQFVKENVENSLGITVSVGISLTKSLAKLASNFQKPSGLTVVSGRQIETLLKQSKVQDVWGIGFKTASYLQKLNINTALDFVHLPEDFIKNKLSKPFWEIWQELRGKTVYQINPNPKTTYFSIGKTKTFTPATNNYQVLWSRLLQNIEEAFSKARQFNYQVSKLSFFLKTSDFRYQSSELILKEETSQPRLILDEIKKSFNSLFKINELYRATGCYLHDLTNNRNKQPSLFTDFAKEKKLKTVYSLVESGKVDFGSSLYSPKPKARATVYRLNLPLVNLTV